MNLAKTRGILVGLKGLNGRSFTALKGQSRQYSAAYSSSLCETFYNEEQLEMQKSFSKFIDKNIAPFVEEWEAKEGISREDAKVLFKKLGNEGFLGVNKPKEYGGMGLPFKYHSAIMEEAGTIKCGGIPMAIGAHTDITSVALIRFGSHELKKEFLEPSISGDVISCLGVTEPGGGSDVAAIKTNAVKKGEDYIINGSKMFITNALNADWCCLLANTSTGPPHKNKSLICVPMDTPGISRQKINKIGMNSSDTGFIFFDNVRVPAKNIIGDEGMGFFYQMLQFQNERLGLCLMYMKTLDMLISITIEYTRERKAFGQSILDNQVVHFKLAELATEIEALRALIYMGLDLAEKDPDRDRTLLASMVKLKFGRLTRIVPDQLLQFWGGMGYSRDNLISRFYRDMRIMPIGGGSDETMQSIICKLIGIAPKTNK